MTKMKLIYGRFIILHYNSKTLGKEKQTLRMENTTITTKAEDSNYCYVWTLNPLHGKCDLTLTITTKLENSVCISYNGRMLASETEATKIKIMQIDPLSNCFGKQLQILSGHTDIITSINFSHNNCYLISGSVDKSTVIWGIDSNDKESYGKIIARLTGHNGFIIDACFSPDSKLVVTAGLVKQKTHSIYGAVIWHLDHKNTKYKPIKILAQPYRIKTLRFSEDGKMLAILYMENISIIWNVDLTSLEFGNKIAKLSSRNNDWIHKNKIK